MERVKRPVLERRQAEFDLNPQDRSGRRVAYFEQVEVTYGKQAVLRGIRSNRIRRENRADGLERRGKQRF